MACDPSCATMYPQGGMGCGGSVGCGGGMMGSQGYQGPVDCGTGCGMGYPGAGWGPGGAGCQPGFTSYQQGPAMSYQQGPAMGYQQGPATGYQQGPATGYQRGPATGYQQGPAYQQRSGCQPQGCQTGPFEQGSGCGGLNIPCSPQGADIPPQARARKPRPPSSTVPKRKVGTSYTTLVTPLAGAKELTEEDTKNIPPDHERFDTLTLAFGTKPGTDKPPKILLTLKSPKVIDAKLSTGTAATQVHYRDLGLPDPSVKPDDTKSRAGSRMSRKSRQSTNTVKSKASKKGSKGKKGKK